MKKITVSILTIALAASAAFAQKTDRSVRPKPGPAPEIKLGKTESFTLPNGLKVFVVENHKLPTVNYDIQFDIKPALEGNMTGYRDMMSDLLLSGTRNRSKDQLNEQIDFIGARIRASDKEIEGSALKKHQTKLLELMSDIALNTQMKQEELDKIKTRTVSALQTAKNEPDAMLRNVSAVINFGNNHPYGEIATDETVKNISLERCQKYFDTYFRPNVAYLAVVGDITVAEVKPLIEKYFGSWQKAEVPVAAYTIPPAPTTARVAFVPRDAAVQSVINVTYPIDLKPGTPDVIRANVANTILGGGSQGRLFLNLREQHAWTYGAYSSIQTDELMGTFTAYAKCRNLVSDSSVGEIVAEMRKLQTEPVASETLQNTIAYLSGGFAIGLEDPSRVAQYAINIERYHMPKDYYQNYLKNLAAVTAEDVRAAAAKYIHPDQANIVVVGNKADVAEKLKVFAKSGNVEYFDNYGREVKPATAQAVPANVTFKDIMKKQVASQGGEKALAALKDIKTVSEGSFQGRTLEIVEMKKFNGKMKTTLGQGGNVVQKRIFNGEKGFQEQMGQKQDMDEEDVNEYKESTDALFPMHNEKTAIKRVVKSIEQVDGKDMYVVEATNVKGTVVTEYYDVNTGLMMKKTSSMDTPKGPMSVTIEYSDYKEVPGTKGYKIPYTVSIPLGPGLSLVTAVKTVEVNKNIPDSEFQ